MFTRSDNAVFLLNYHLVIVVKYRKQLFTYDAIVQDLKQLVEQVANKHGITVISQECGTDHIHILFKCKPTTNLTLFVNTLKGYTSRMLRELHVDLIKPLLWGDALWSPSYFLATAGNVSLDTLVQYINNQRTVSC